MLRSFARCALTSVTKPRVTVVGLGRMGALRAELVKSSGNFELVSVVDSNPERAIELARRLGCQPRTSLDTATLSEVDAVIVSTPTSLHGPDVAAALRARKPVMVEKPLTNNKHENMALYKLANETRTPLACNFMRRSSDRYRAVREQFSDGGAGGRVLSIYMAGLDHPTPPPSVLAGLGSLYEDMAVHELDTALWFYG